MSTQPLSLTAISWLWYSPDTGFAIVMPKPAGAPMTLAEVTTFVTDIYQRRLGRTPEAGVAADVLRRRISAQVFEAEIIASAEGQAYATKTSPPTPVPVPNPTPASNINPAIVTLTTAIADLHARMNEVEKSTPVVSDLRSRVEALESELLAIKAAIR